jgi:hypothetical protein
MWRRASHYAVRLAAPAAGAMIAVTASLRVDDAGSGGET